jgi:hypothetical protein
MEDGHVGGILRRTVDFRRSVSEISRRANSRDAVSDFGLTTANAATATVNGWSAPFAQLQFLQNALPGGSREHTKPISRVPAPGSLAATPA